MCKRFLRNIFSSTEEQEKLNEWTEMKRHRALRTKGHCSFSTKRSRYRNYIIFHEAFIKSNKPAFFISCIRLELSEGHPNYFLFPQVVKSGLRKHSNLARTMENWWFIFHE
jgi:hypothetical protein